MSFEEIISMMENAEDYTDLYDAATYIVDDDLRNKVEQAIGVCEDDGDTVEEAYSILTSDLLYMHIYELNEGLDITAENKTLNSYIADIKEVSNDKDLLNILDEMLNNKDISNDIVDNIRQLFKNNRYMPLKSKIEAIMRFIDSLGIKEVKTESVSNIDKQDKTLDSIIDDKENEDTLLDNIKDRTGQQMSVGDFNKFLQTTFNQFNKLFLLDSDLYSMDLSANQYLEIKEDDKVYTVNYNIVDVDNSIIEITNASVE